MTRKLELEVKILQILAEEEKTEKHWSQEALRTKLKLGESQKSQIHRAIQALEETKHLKKESPQFLTERNLNKNPLAREKARRQKSTPILLTQWGLLRYLSHILLEKPNPEKPDLDQCLDKSLKAIEKNYGEHLLLAKSWEYFRNEEMQLHIIKRMQRYFKEQGAEHFLVAPQSSEQEEIDKLVNYVLFDSIIQPYVDELEDNPNWIENWLDLTAKNPEIAKYVENKFRLLTKTPSEKRKLFYQAKQLTKKRPKKMEILLKNLLLKKSEFYDKTGYKVVLLDELDEFLQRKLLNLYKEGKLSEIKAKRIIKLGYRAWVGLNVILMLNPTNFSTLDENLEFHATEKKLQFFTEKTSFSRKGNSPNFAFFSGATKAWIGFGIGKSVDYYSSRPDIWLSKAPKLTVLRYFGFGKTFLIEPEEEKGWSNMNERYERSEIQVLGRFVINLEPECLFAVSWSKESKYPYLPNPKLRILNGVDFNQKRLRSIINAIKLK